MQSSHSSAKKQPYKLSLGHVLVRARYVFLGLIVLLVVLFGFASYAEAKTGQGNKFLLAPLKNFASAVTKAFESTPPKGSNTTYTFTSTTNDATTSSETIEDEFEDYKVDTTTEVDYQAPIVKYNYSDKSYEDALKAQEEWWKQAQAENQAKSAASQKSFDEFKAKSEADFKQAQLEGQQGLEAFRQQQQAAQEEFKKANGF